MRIASFRSSFSTKSAMNSLVEVSCESKALASSLTLARSQSSCNGDTGVFTTSSLPMFCVCHNCSIETLATKYVNLH